MTRCKTWPHGRHYLAVRKRNQNRSANVPKTADPDAYTRHFTCQQKKVRIDEQKWGLCPRAPWVQAGRPCNRVRVQFPTCCRIPGASQLKTWLKRQESWPRKGMRERSLGKWYKTLIILEDMYCIELLWQPTEKLTPVVYLCRCRRRETHDFRGCFREYYPHLLPNQNRWGM